MLRERVLSAAVLAPLVGMAAWLGGWWFAGLVALFALLAAWELFTLMARAEMLQPLPWLGAVIAAGLVMEAGLPADGRRLQALLVLIILAGLVIMLFRNRPRAPSDWLLTLGGALYVGFTLRFLVLLRGEEGGLGWVALAALTTWIADSGAYFIGKGIGRHKLWPRISPKKTWEGLIGGLIAGAAAAVLLAPILVPGLDWSQGLVLGVIVSLAAPLGDLSESLFKRQVGAKDSSHLIPGHGGFLDRIDSFTFVSPVVFLLAWWWG